MRINRLGSFGALTATLAICGYFGLTAVASAKFVEVKISQETFKSRCQAAGGTYTDHGDQRATCKLPSGQWATCDFLIGSCETSRIAPPWVGEAGPDRVGPRPVPESLTSSDSDGSSTASPGAGSGGGKGSYAGGAGGGSGSVGGGSGGPLVK